MISENVPAATRPDAAGPTMNLVALSGLDVLERYTSHIDRLTAHGCVIEIARLLAPECGLCGIPHTGPCRNPLYPLRRGVSP